MAMSELPILKPVTTGFVDAFAAIRIMPFMAGFAVLILLAAGLTEYIVPSNISDDFVMASLASFIVSTAQSFFLTPIMIAVHRFIILGEVTPHYTVQPRQRVFQMFFSWLMALSVVGLLTVVLFAPDATPSFATLGMVLVATIVVVVVMIRLSILLPAIAVEAPGATAANAWADSKKHTFRIFLIFLLAVVPVFIGGLFVMFPFVLSADAETGKPGVLAMIIMAVVQMLATVLFVAIASRLYQALADRLLRA